MEPVEIVLVALMIVLARHWEILVEVQILLEKDLVEVHEKTVEDWIVGEIAEERILEEGLELEI